MGFGLKLGRIVREDSRPVRKDRAYRVIVLPKSLRPAPCPIIFV